MSKVIQSKFFLKIRNEQFKEINYRENIFKPVKLIRLSIIERIVPTWCSDKLRKSPKLQSYLLAKNYLKSQICIKNLISKLNELEKLKIFCLSIDQLNFFENIANPSFELLYSYDKGKLLNLWRDLYLKNFKFQLLSHQQIRDNLMKTRKNNVNVNILNLINNIVT